MTILPLLVESQVFGRDAEFDRLIDLLLKPVDASDISNQNVCIMTIVGMGGVGKTTLTQKAYNDKRVEEHFQLKCWVCMSENFSVEGLTKEIIESAIKKKCDLRSFDALQVVLKEHLSSRRFLLVLDDVWNEDKHKWERLCTPLRSAVPGSKIVVTTRSTQIAEMVSNVGAIHLNGLDEENSWALFKKCAFDSRNSGDQPQLEAIAKKIVPKLGGLPLAAKTIGGLLNVKMDAKHWKTILNSEIWQLHKDENGVLPVLQLSYQFLPTHLKKCFAICSLFPKDYCFDEHQLIGFWMAEGFIVEQESMRMEDIGANYFHALVSRSLFQRTQHGGYIMHDLIHDLAELISAGESYRVDVGKSQEIPKMLRHLSICAEKDQVELRRVKEFVGYNKLWTLILYDDRKRLMIFNRLFQRLKSIRVLVLRNHAMKEFPESIGNLIHLRYFDVSFNQYIQRLPESICDLYNLQTLILTGCHNLQSLPQGMSRLINLRHLETTDNMISEIVEVRKLTSLQQLSAFKVSNDPGHKLEELSELTQLHGRLRIMNLENVENKEEASCAKLKRKEFLEELMLEWEPATICNLEKNNVHISDEVLEGLQPHHMIKCLEIKEYNGAKPPSWLDAEVLLNLETLTLVNCKRWEDISSILQLAKVKCLHLKGMAVKKRISHDLFVPSSTKCRFFSRLERLVLEDLPLLEELPVLGQIPCLKFLSIGNMAAIKRIGPSFFGYSDQSMCFPELRDLSIVDMPALEEWSWVGGKEPCQADRLFACLSNLDISSCPLLKSVPPIPSSLETLHLRHLGLTKLPKLHEEVNAGAGKIVVSLSVIDICDCPNLTSLEQGLLSYHLPNIQTINIQYCGELLWMPIKRFGELTTLKILHISGCPKLGHTTTQDEDVHLPLSITGLTLRNCGDLIFSLSKCLHNLVSLIRLDIELCPNIVALPIGSSVRLRKLFLQNCNELISVDGLCVDSLFELAITGCPKLLLYDGEEQRTPSSLRRLRVDNTALLKLSPLKNALSSITYLMIISSSQVVMFEGEEQGLLLSMKDLAKLTFAFCKDLLSLPSQLHTLPSLKVLTMFDCPSIESLPEKGLPNSLTRLKFIGCHPKLTAELEKQVAMMNSSGRLNHDGHSLN